VAVQTGPADYQYFKHQQGDKIGLKFGGFKSTAIHAIMRMLDLKDPTLLQKIRLIERGALSNG